MTTNDDEHGELPQSPQRPTRHPRRQPPHQVNWSPRWKLWVPVVLVGALVVLGGIVSLGGDEAQQGTDSPVDTVSAFGAVLARGDCEAASEYTTGAALSQMAPLGTDCPRTTTSNVQLISQTNSEAVVTGKVERESIGVSATGTFELIVVSGAWKISTIDFE